MKNSKIKINFLEIWNKHEVLANDGWTKQIELKLSKLKALDSSNELVSPFLICNGYIEHLDTSKSNFKAIHNLQSEQISSYMLGQQKRSSRSIRKSITPLQGSNA